MVGGRRSVADAKKPAGQVDRPVICFPRFGCGAIERADPRYWLPDVGHDQRDDPDGNHRQGDKHQAADQQHRDSRIGGPGPGL